MAPIVFDRITSKAALAAFSDSPDSRFLAFARLKVYLNCCAGVHTMYPCAATNVIQPPMRLCTSRSSPRLLMKFEPPTRSECPAYSFDHGLVIKGTHSLSACLSALTADS